MQIQVNTGPNIQASNAFITQVTATVESALNRFEQRISRVEVHLSDQNSDKKFGPADMRCMLEARLEGRRPLAVTHQDDSLDQAIAGAADKLANVIDSTLGKERDRARQQKDPLLSVTEPAPEQDAGH